MSPGTRPGALAVWAAWALLAAALFVASAPARLPGPYYDEAFLAQQARDFLEPGRPVEHPPSTREVELLGRPLPLRNAVYLGSLKSQLLIPVFALFGTDLTVLRLATLGTSLVALLLVMLWTRHLLGGGVAVLGGVLVATDPSYRFLSLYEWGPFTTLLLCRAAGFLWLTRGWAARRGVAVVAGGLALGLGVYARADFVVVLLAAAAALLAVRPALLGEALRSRRGHAGLLAVSLAAGAAPMWLSAPALLETTTSPVIGRRGDLAEKLRVLGSLVDGSHFHRLIASGGRFDRLFDVDAPSGGLGLAFAAALVAAAVSTRSAVRRGERPAAVSFLLLVSLLTLAGTLAVPGAVRAHHLLNALPFPHLFAAALGIELWRRAGAGATPRTARVALGVLLAVLLAGQLRVAEATRALIERTGGRGRWSDAVREPARLLEEHPELRGVSLDWGLHEPLLFLTERARLVEPIWQLQQAARTGRRLRLSGSAGDLYLLHEPDYDLFGFGPRFLAAVRALGPGAAETRVYRDREGGVAFLGVRLTADHRIAFSRGFEIELLDRPGAGAPRPQAETGS
jgi:hypothetical protein